MFVPRSKYAARRPAYSLIELVVVLMIIAIVSGLTVSIVGWLRRSADKGTASNVMASLLSNIEMYRVTLGAYPDKFDSLIEDGGGASFPSFLPSAFTSGSKFTTTTLTAGEATSLNKIGLSTLMDHVAVTDPRVVEDAPGNTGVVPRAIAASGTVTGISSLTVIDSIYPPTTTSGDGVPLGVKLVVFGFGPRNESVGQTIMSPPSYSGVGDPSQVYDRYLCVFAVYDSGKRAQLKAVLDTTGDFLYQELAEFWDNKPE